MCENITQRNLQVFADIFGEVLYGPMPCRHLKKSLLSIGLTCKGFLEVYERRFNPPTKNKEVWKVFKKWINLNSYKRMLFPLFITANRAYGPRTREIMGITCKGLNNIFIKTELAKDCNYSCVPNEYDLVMWNEPVSCGISRTLYISNNWYNMKMKQFINRDIRIEIENDNIHNSLIPLKTNEKILLYKQINYKNNFLVKNNKNYDKNNFLVKNNKNYDKNNKKKYSIIGCIRH